MVRAPLHFHGRIPVPEVAPLTYRDGVTHLELVYELSQYLKNVLHPSLQSTVDQVVADAEQLLSDATAQYVDGVKEFQRIHDAFMSDVNAHLMALNDGAVSDLVNDGTSMLGEALRSIFTTHVNFDEYKDTVDKGFNDYRETVNTALENTQRDLDAQMGDFSNEVSQSLDDMETGINQSLDTMETGINRFQDQTTAQLNSLEMHPALVRLKAQLAFGEGGLKNLSWLVFLGSSTTGGANIPDVRDRWVFRIKDYLKNVYTKNPVTYTTLPEASSYHDFVDRGVHVVNGGIGGTTSRNYVNQDQLNRVERIRGRRSFVHMIGSNDQSLNIPLEEYAANVNKAIEDLDRVTDSKNAHILVHAYERLDVVSKPDIHDWSHYGEALKSVADMDPDTRMFIDLSPHYKSLGFPHSDDLGIMQERVHQNERGHHLMADLLRDYLRIPDISVSPQMKPTIIGGDRFISSGNLTGGARPTDQGEWSRRGAQWDCAAGYANPRDESIGMMSAGVGGHGVEARLRLENVPKGARAGVTVALRSSQGVYFLVYFRNDQLTIARVNSEGSHSTNTSVGHVMDSEVFLKVEYNRGTINVWVDHVLKLSSQALPLQEFFHADASWCGMYANRSMTKVFREIRMWSLKADR